MHHEKKIKLAIGILLIIALISGSYLGIYFISLLRATGEFNNLAEIFHGSQLQEEKVTDTNQVPIQNKEEKILAFHSLYSKNNDLAGWLVVPNTNIDYPIMFTPDDPEYYLRRNFEKKYSPNGTPFIDGQCSLEPLSDNLIIHGHNMKDGTIFANLLLYEEKEFWQNHPQLEFYLHGEKQTYDIIAAFRTEVYNNKSEFKYYDFINSENEEEFDDYLTMVKEIALYETGLTAQYGDHLLTLSTCAYHTTNGRFVLLARAFPHKKEFHNN